MAISTVGERRAALGLYSFDSGGLPAPDAPTLSVTSRSSTIVIGSWTTGGHADNYKVYLDGARWPDASTTYLSSPLAITGLTASTAYTLKVAGSNATADADSNTVSFTTSAGSPILTRLETQALTLIEAMTTVGGYNYDWGNCNQPDAAKKDAYPNAEIYILDEDNDDGEDGAHANAYENKANIEIHVWSKMSTRDDVPTFAINAFHNKALDDLKRLFGLNPSVNDSINMILYRGSRRETDTGAGDIFKPAKMITTWSVSYTQDRQSPEINAN